jgi:hypothetical protein
MIAVYLGLILSSGCSPSRIAGGSASEGEAKIIGTIVYPKYHDASSPVIVKLRSVNFLKTTGTSDTTLNDSSTINTFLDTNGNFEIDSVYPGSYLIEVNDGHSYATVIPVTNTGIADTIILQPDSLRQTGTISGNFSIGKNGYVQVYGLDRVANVDAATGLFVIPDVPKGTYTVRFVFSSPGVSPKTTTSITVVPRETVIVPLSSWIFSKQLILNTTPSGANVMGTVVHFPILVRLSSSNFAFNTAASDGRDVRFSRPDNTPLPFEIERWDAVSGQAELWVKMDTVYGNSASQYITMSWGNSSASPASNPAMTFDTADNFQGVWHLADSGISTIKDATANHYNGIRYGTTPPRPSSGVVGLSQTFDGATGYIRFPNTAASSLNFPAKGHYTLSAWVYSQVLDSAFHQILSKGDQQYGLQIRNTNKWELFEFDENQGWQSVYSPAASKQWVYLTGVCDGTGKYIYVNGVLASNTIIEGNSTIRNTSYDVVIGRISDTSFSMRYWNGYIDEVNCSSTARSSEWIKLSYMNQKTRDALITFR